MAVGLWGRGRGRGRDRYREEAGAVEEDRTTTKVDSSNSSSSMEASSTIRQVSAKATTQAETTKAGHHSRVYTSVALELERAQSRPQG